MRPRIRPFGDRDAEAVVALSRRTRSSGRWPRRPLAGWERRYVAKPAPAPERWLARCLREPYQKRGDRALWVLTMSERPGDARTFLHRADDGHLLPCPRRRGRRDRWARRGVRLECLMDLRERAAGPP